jgi:lipid II:glycine glycyltransferase (peptidoglycan interpeptide bridge formation enzyme)
MQPSELFIIDITKSEEDLLAEMKPKTRYNIKVAQKHSVGISREKKYLDDFLRLIKITAIRDKIAPHPDEYYRKMFEIIPEENLKIYLAEFEGKIIAANIVVFYGKFATYLHGASDNEYRSIMAPYLLQWQAIIDAKMARCNFYDLGGVKTHNANRIAHNADDTRYVIRDTSSWAGITRFKIGFSANTEPIIFPGSYDMILNSFKYNLYRILQRMKNIF